MPIQRCMAETSSRDFLDWQKYFEHELNMPRREDYYLAQIAAEVRRTIAKDPQAEELEDFLLTFTTGKPKPPSPPTEEELAARVAQSKAKWAGVAGGTRKPPPQKKGIDDGKRNRT